MKRHIGFRTLFRERPRHRVGGLLRLTRRGLRPRYPGGGPKTECRGGTTRDGSVACPHTMRAIT